MTELLLCSPVSNFASAVDTTATQAYGFNFTNASTVDWIVAESYALTEYPN